jgi:hypothetical protein
VARPFPLAVAALSLVAVALLGPGAASAQEISARTYLTPGGTVALGSTFVLNLEVTGTQTLDKDPVLPDLAGFAQYLGSGTSTSMQISGGQTLVSLTIQYRFQAVQEGAFQIGSIEVAAGGTTFSTEPLAVTVSSSSTQGQTGDPTSSGISATDLFVTAETSKARVLEGEPFSVEYRIWTRVDVGSYSLTQLPEPEGFWVEDLGQVTQPQVEEVFRDGQQYVTAVIRRVALIPTGSGERTLEPLGIEAQVQVRRRGNDPFERLFGRSSVFGTTTVPTTVLSNPVTIDVEPLPPGRPEPFSGVVGSLGIEAELDRDTVAANDAVTLTIRVSGRGNLRAVPAPIPDLPSDFEVFPPEVSESIQPRGSGLGGSKTFQYVMIPRAPGARSIPSIALGYFDTSAGTYRTAATGDIPLMVTGTVAEGPGGIARGGVAQLREDIRFIHLGDGRLRPRNEFLLDQAAFWIFMLLPMVGILGSLGLRRHRDRLAVDPAYARGRRAGRVARKRLAEARELAALDDSQAFFAEVARALRGFVADKLNVAEAGMQMSDLSAHLSGHGVSDPIAKEVVDCLEHCDRQRFAPATAGVEERGRFLERASNAMTSLDREIR